MINYVLSKDKTYYVVNTIGFSRPDGAVLILNTYDGVPVKEIAEEAFIGCTDITSIKIGDNVTKIGAGAFKNCINLREVTFSKSLQEIGEGAFLCCSSLLTAILPDGLKIIGKEAFLGCKNLVKLKIPATLEEGGYMAFADCRKLVGFSNINGIASKDFVECTSFYKSAIEISKNIEYNIRCDKEGFIFYTNDDKCVLLGHKKARALSGEVVLPSDFEGKPYAISKDAFYGANEITSVTIPDGVTQIGDGAFYYCYRIKKTNIPVSIKKIGVDVFFGCPLLTSIEIANDKKWTVKKPLSNESKEVEEKLLSSKEKVAQTLTKKYLSYEWTSLVYDDTVMQKY